MLSLLPETVQRDYSRYTRGARDDEARAAKRLYMRETRALARVDREIFELLNPGAPYVAAGITHGTHGYWNRGCRCRVCVRARKLRRIEYERKRAN